MSGLVEPAFLFLMKIDFAPSQGGSSLTSALPLDDKSAQLEDEVFSPALPPLRPPPPKFFNLGRRYPSFVGFVFSYVSWFFKLPILGGDEKKT